MILKNWALLISRVLLNVSMAFCFRKSMLSRT